jgi:hypothetical protein
MKIKIQCKSLLLEKALKIFLKDYVVSRNYNILISDYEINSTKLFLINNTNKTNILKPFTKENLITRLNNFQTIKEQHIEDEMRSLLEEYTYKLTQLNKKKYA